MNIHQAIRSIGHLRRRELERDPRSPMSRELAEITAAVSCVIESSGFILDPDAIDHCHLCRRDYQRRNKRRHYMGRHHREGAVRRLMAPMTI